MLRNLFLLPSNNGQIRPHQELNNIRKYLGLFFSKIFPKPTCALLWINFP